MIVALPPYVTLRAGERALALIPQDRQVGFLNEALLTVGGLIVLTLGTIWFNALRGFAPEAPGGSTFFSILFLIGPVIVGRFLRKPAVYVLTNQRLIVAEDDEIDLRDISRLRVWTTRVVVYSGRLKSSLTDLVNPPAVATLIRDAIAVTGGR
ncbi:MAG: hypothetical protein ACK4HW_00630 [Roseinatronobacter sp.]